MNTPVALHMNMTEIHCRLMLWTMLAFGILTGRYSEELSGGINQQSRKDVQQAQEINCIG